MKGGLAQRPNIVEDDIKCSDRPCNRYDDTICCTQKAKCLEMTCPIFYIDRPDDLQDGRGRLCNGAECDSGNADDVENCCISNHLFCQIMHKKSTNMLSYLISHQYLNCGVFVHKIKSGEIRNLSCLLVVTKPYNSNTVN